MTLLTLRKSISYISFLFVLVFNFQNAFSQSKYTVLLPEIDKAIPLSDPGYLEIKANENGAEIIKSFFKFDFKNLPINSKIDALIFKLYVKQMGNSLNTEHPVYVLKGTNDWDGNETELSDPKLSWAITEDDQKENVGYFSIKINDSIIIIKLKENVIINANSGTLPKENLSLAIRSPKPDHQTKFYSSSIAENQGSFSKKPKILVEYEIKNYPSREDWSQSFVNAQHYSSTNWKANTPIISAQFRKLYNEKDGNIQDISPTGALLIYKNQPIIFTQSSKEINGYTFFVKQLDSKGNVMWTKGVDDVARCWPLIDEYGRLYYFSRAGKLTILDLNNRGEVLYRESFSDITNQLIETINNNVTLGYDGTLYLPTNKGIVALTAYPKFKIRWFYRQLDNEINGPVSLSLDENKAFFINVNTQQGMSRLMMLDNMDGTPIDASAYDLGGYKNDNNYYIPAPVVLNNEKVFVLNGFDNAEELFAFDYTEQGKIKIDTIISASGISQPVVVDSKVFFVFNKKLASYDPVNGSIYTFNNSSELDKASILVADASSNIYAIDPYSNPRKILGFKNDLDSPNLFSLNIDAKDNLKKNIVLAPDGTIYTITLNNLIAIAPSNVALDSLTLVAKETAPLENQTHLEKNTVYRANKSITVEGMNVNSSINAILYSGGSISFKQGFSIKKGAKLTCKVGY